MSDTKQTGPEIRFTTPNGDRMVMLPEALFERLVEIAEEGIDAAAVAAWRTRPGKVWPLEVVEALSEGANPIRVYRKHFNMTQTDLARATGLSNAYLSEIETGKQEGSVDARRKIAKALDVTLDDLEPWETEAEAVEAA